MDTFQSNSFAEGSFRPRTFREPAGPAPVPAVSVSDRYARTAGVSGRWSRVQAVGDRYARTVRVPGQVGRR